MFKTVALAGALAAVAYADHADGEPFTEFTANVGDTHTHEFEITKSGITVKVISNNEWTNDGNLHETLISFNGGEQQKINVETYYNAETATFDQTRSFNDDCTWNLAEETLNEWKSCGVEPGNSKNVSMRSNVDIGGNVSSRIVGSDWVAETTWSFSEYFSIYVDLETQTWHETLFVNNTKVAEIKWVFPAFNNPDHPYWAGGCRRSVESQQSYHRFAMLMAQSYPEYSWEAIPVETADGYHLTTFHVWHEQNRDKSLGPVFFQHGGYSDAAMWTQAGTNAGRDAQQIQMVAAGYDVYIGNNRGTEYSSGHDSLAYTSEEYWSYDFEGYTEDVLANMKMMFDHSGEKKGYYYGFSLGTVQMLMALPKFEAQLKDYLNKVVLLAPCMFLSEQGYTMLGTEEPMRTVGYYTNEMKKAGVYALKGPNWDMVKIKEQASEEAAAFSDYWFDGFAPVGLKLQDHFFQLSTLKRFQKYAPDYFVSEEESGTKTVVKEADLFDLASISSIPISLINGLSDTSCEAAMTDETAEILQTLDNYISIQDKGHMHFDHGNQPDYIALLLSEAKTTGDKVKKTVVLEEEPEVEPEVLGGGIVATDGEKKKEGAMATQAVTFCTLMMAAVFLQ